MKTFLQKDTILSRIKEAENLRSDAQLAEYLGVTKAAISNWKARGSVDYDLLFSKCEHINFEWLLTGNGNMYRDGKQFATLVEPDERGVPYFAVDFVGGFDFIFNSNTSTPSAFISCPTVKDAQCWVDICGKSMEPLIANGDIIALRQVLNPSDGILYGEIYAIVTDDFRTVKRIKRCSNDDYITLVPENPDYDPQELPRTKIRALYKVLGCTKKFF